MKRMGNMAKRFVAVAMSVAMVAAIPGANFKAFATQGLDSVQAASAVTRSSIHDGTILHAFCWNFNTIKEKMPEIAAAGYTAVQTSPINECLSIHNGMALYGDTEDEGRWYYHYQPTDWKIGNYQLGSRDEFKAMCDEAEKYGIGVIVDIDPNHTTPVFDQVSDDLKASAGGEDSLYHIGAKDGGMAYDNRISVTYDAMGGLPDVDTENAGFQNYFYEFLQDCIACGADGFRIDTAKHIALPDDGVAEEYAGQEGRNNFYPNMKAAIDEKAAKSYDDLFVYGEVLDGDASRLAAYQDMLGGTCASNYGGTIRNAASSGNVAANRIMNYKINDDNSTGHTYKADSNKLVTWVESHDNYINDKSYNEIDDEDVILAWAIITARADGTPLFFSRPDGSSKENPWGNNRIGAAGSDIYKAPEVVAVNKFRTAMEGQSEYLRNPGNNNSILMIERGDKGVVIVNASEADFNLDSVTNLSDGTYVDSVEGQDGLYTVSDGNIYGTVPARSVVVLDKQADGDYSTLFFHNTDGWSSVRALADGNSFDCDYTENDWWKVTIPAKEFKVVFTDGTNKSAEFAINEKSGKFMTAKLDKIFASKAEAEDALGIITKTVYFLNTEEWKTVYAYAWTDSTQYFGGWPGAATVNEEGYWWKADVKMIGDHNFSIIFNNNDGSQTVDIDMSDMSKNVIVVAPEQPGGNLAVERYASKAEAEEATGINAGSTTVHYYNAAGWDTVGVYTWGDVSLGDWPGKQAEYEGDNWWKLTIDCAPSSNFNIIFNNLPTSDDNKHQTEDMKCDSLKNVYYIGASYKYGSKEAALKALENDNLILEKNLNPETNPIDTPTDRPVEEETSLGEDEVKIYYYNTANWNEVNMYAWTDGANTEYFGGWPGKAMQHIGGNWYSVSVNKAALTHEGLHLIANGGGTQINDVELISERPTIEDKPEEPKPEEPKKFKDIEQEPELAEGKTRVYYKLGADWDSDVFMYGWLKQADGTSAGEPLGGWPGTKMTHIGNGWHSVDIDSQYLEDVVSGEKVEDVLEAAADEVKADENQAEVADEVLASEEAVESVTEEVSEESEESVVDEIVSFLQKVQDVVKAAFAPIVVNAEEAASELQLIVNDNGKHQQIEGDKTLVTTVRPSAEELKQEEENVEPTPAPAPAPQPSKPSSGSGSSSNTGSSSGSRTSATPTQQIASIAESQVPLGVSPVTVAEDSSVVKKVASKISKKSTVKPEESSEDKEAEEETAEDAVEELDAEIPEVDEAASTEPEEDEVVRVVDEGVPEAAVETGSTNLAVIIAIIVAAVVILGGAGFVVVRKRK